MFRCADSQADCHSGVDISTVDCGTLTSWEDCRSRVDIATVDFWTAGFSDITVSGVWIGARGVVSSCGDNLDSICSGPRLFTRVGDIGSEEQRQAFMWSWRCQITHPSCNFIKKDRASIPSKTCPASHPGLLLKLWVKTSWPLRNIHILAILLWWNFWWS